MDGNGLPHGITALAFVMFIVLGLACASTPDNLNELTTYSELIEAHGLSQLEVFDKVILFFYEAFKGQTNSVIQVSDQNSGIIKGKLVVDGVRRNDYLYRYNSIFTVEISDETCKITFTEPTTQNIGFVSEQAKETAFRSYLTGRRASGAAVSQLTGVSTSSSTQTDAEIRREWETKNVFSITKPGNESPVRYDFEVENVRGQWTNFINRLKEAISVD